MAVFYRLYSILNALCLGMGWCALVCGIVPRWLALVCAALGFGQFCFGLWFLYRSKPSRAE